jgi:rhodanese-related sulfurtransferase
MQLKFCHFILKMKKTNIRTLCFTLVMISSLVGTGQADRVVSASDPFFLSRQSEAERHEEHAADAMQELPLISVYAVHTVLNGAIEMETGTVEARSTYHVVNVFPEIDFRDTLHFPASSKELSVPEPLLVSHPVAARNTEPASAIASDRSVAPGARHVGLLKNEGLSWAFPEESGASPEHAGQSRVPATSSIMTPPAKLVRAVSVETVIQQISQQQRVMLVDVRKKSGFEQFRIPGSLNIPLFAVKTKTFLRNTPLILVDEGYRPRQLEEACEQFTQAGFEARFLYGGLNAWRAHGAPLQGDRVAQKNLNRVPPQQFFAEQDEDTWLVIDVSASQRADTRALIPQAISLPYRKDDAQFVETFKKMVATRTTHPQRFVLVVDQQGARYDPLERMLQNTGVQPVFFLQGGLRAYTQCVTQQARIRQGQEELTTAACTRCAR